MMLTRFCFQRALACIYLVGFLIAAFQARALIGSNGLLPAPLFIKSVRFWDSPSLFWFHYSDSLLIAVAWIGVALSIFAISGFSEKFNLPVSVVTWFLMWVFYLSIVNIGQRFYSFGWETLLLETGFLAIFLGPTKMAPPTLVIWLLRWVLFRLMFGAGLIKLRGDECWRDLTCMYYHYETQPLPNPLSYFFHYLPPGIHRATTFLTHVLEIIVPFGFFGPSRIRNVAGLLTIGFQVILILSGNLSWLNCITIVLCIACLNDSLLSKIFPLILPVAPQFMPVYTAVIYAVTLLVAILSFNPVMNLISSRQIMNTSFDPLHLVNTYGAFGSITRVRNEIIIEGTDEPEITPTTWWEPYEFKGKPGSVSRRPRQVTPYHYKLDWQMWFAAMSDYSYHPWFLNLVSKLLQNDREVIGLIERNPFPNKPPTFVRARLYEYHYALKDDKTGNWWRRELRGQYLPPLSLQNSQFRKILREQGWLD